MNPSEVPEIESSSPDPVAPTGSSAFNREKAKQMIRNIYPDADVTTVEACLSLSVYRQITKVPLPKSDDDVVQQINDLLNEDAASTSEPEDPLDVRSMDVEETVEAEQETFKIPRIVCSPEVQVIHDRRKSIWMHLDTPTDIHRRVVVTEEEDWRS